MDLRTSHGEGSPGGAGLGDAAGSATGFGGNVASRSRNPALEARIHARRPRPSGTDVPAGFDERESLRGAGARGFHSVSLFPFQDVTGIISRYGIPLSLPPSGFRPSPSPSGGRCPRSGCRREAPGRMEFSRSLRALGLSRLLGNLIFTVSFSYRRPSSRVKRDQKSQIPLFAHTRFPQHDGSGTTELQK